MEISRDEGMKLLAKAFNELAPRIPLTVKNIMVLTTVVGTIMDFTVENMEWQYQLDIGAKRFRDRRFGPWTKWTSVEA